MSPHLNQARIMAVYFNSQVLTGELRHRPYTFRGWHQGKGATQAAIWVRNESVPPSLPAPAKSHPPLVCSLFVTGTFPTLPSVLQWSGPVRTWWLAVAIFAKKSNCLAFKHSTLTVRKKKKKARMSILTVNGWFLMGTLEELRKCVSDVMPRSSVSTEE